MSWFRRKPETPKEPTPADRAWDELIQDTLAAPSDKPAVKPPGNPRANHSSQTGKQDRSGFDATAPASDPVRTKASPVAVLFAGMGLTLFLAAAALLAAKWIAGPLSPPLARSSAPDLSGTPNPRSDTAERSFEPLKSSRTPIADTPPKESLWKKIIPQKEERPKKPGKDYSWVEGYERDGKPVRGYWRKDKK